ncbi:hypothetical protein ABMA10_00210 [Plantibacter sp. RU18]
MPVRVTLLAALCHQRSAEITDGLVELLLGLVLKVNTKAERKVERELTEDLRRVRGKEGLLFRIAEAALDEPDGTVRDTVFPVVGEGTLQDLVREAKANQAAFQNRVRTVLRGSYTNHYRRMLPALLSALRFRCNNTAYQPVLEALTLLSEYADMRGQVRFYAATDQVPIDGVSCPWFDGDSDRPERMRSMPALRKYPAELRERAVRLVFEARDADGGRRGVCTRIGRQLGVPSDTLRGWVQRAEVDGGLRSGTSTDTAVRLVEVEREVRELRRANAILRSASAFFAAELDRPHSR